MVDWNSFRDSIESTFYNETIDIYESVETEDSFGAIIDDELSPYKLNVKCNIQNSNKDIVKKEFGTEIDCKYRISLSNENLFEEDKVYKAKIHSPIKNLDENILYEIAAIQPFNTYVLLLLKEV